MQQPGSLAAVMMGALMQPASMQQQQQPPDVMQVATGFTEHDVAPMDLAEDDQELTIGGDASPAAKEGVVKGKGKGKTVHKARKAEVTLWNT